MKKGHVLSLILFILVCAFLFFYFQKSAFKTTGTPISIFSPPSGSIFNPRGDIDYVNCSNASIQGLWSSIFREESNDLKILSVEGGGECLYFIAYKNKSTELYMLKTFLGNSSLLSSKTDYVIAIWANVTQEYLSQAQILHTVSYPVSFADLFLESSIPAVNLTNRAILSPTSANTTFNNNFKVSRPIFTFVSNNPATSDMFGQNVSYYIFEETNTFSRDVPSSTLKLTSSSATVLADHSFTKFIYSFMRTVCAPNWISVNTSCNQTTNTLISWFNDTNNCRALFPENNYIPPANLTFSCGLIISQGVYGNVSSVSRVNLINLSMEVNGFLLNESANYTGELSMSIKDNSTTLISLTYNFSQALNLSNVRIEKQAQSAAFGYLIISGLNVTKTVYVDRLNSSSNAVCIKDAVVSSVSEISSRCNSTSETIVPCSGNNSSYSCAVSGSRFSISGLTHSAVREISINSVPHGNTCTPSWNCTAWSTCAGRNQIRVCTDINQCNNVSNKPVELQNCAPTCQVNWSCGNWTTCTKSGNQTRTCSDLRNCGLLTDKPSEFQNCTYQAGGVSGSLIKIVIIAVISIIVAVIVVLVIYLLRSNKRDYDESDRPSSKLGPVIPPDVNYTTGGNKKV